MTCKALRPWSTCCLQYYPPPPHNNLTPVHVYILPTTIVFWGVQRSNRKFTKRKWVRNNKIGYTFCLSAWMFSIEGIKKILNIYQVQGNCYKSYLVSFLAFAFLTEDEHKRLCRHFKSCPSCVENSYDCIWCKDGCTYKSCSSGSVSKLAYSQLCV